jgi:hypothetical protein
MPANTLTSAAAGDKPVDTRTLAVWVEPVNDPPRFAMIAAGPVSLTKHEMRMPVLHSAAPGPANEENQTLRAVLQPLCAEPLAGWLVENMQLVPSLGELTLRLPEAANGEPLLDGDACTVLVRLEDDGGTANGGSNVSAPIVVQLGVQLPLPAWAIATVVAAAALLVVLAVGAMLRWLCSMSARIAPQVTDSGELRRAVHTEADTEALLRPGSPVQLPSEASSRASPALEPLTPAVAVDGGESLPLQRSRLVLLPPAARMLRASAVAAPVDPDAPQPVLPGASVIGQRGPAFLPISSLDLTHIRRQLERVRQRIQISSDLQP